MHSQGQKEEESFGARNRGERKSHGMFQLWCQQGDRQEGWYLGLYHPQGGPELCKEMIPWLQSETVNESVKRRVEKTVHHSRGSTRSSASV